MCSGSVVEKNPPKAIALAFGFKENYLPPKEKRSTKSVDDNQKYKCKRCGIAQKAGVVDPLNSLIGQNSNDMYDFCDKQSPFLCSYCIYNAAYYAAKNQKRLDRVRGDIANVIITDRGYTHFIATAGEDNELYDILKKPPRDPCLILLKRMKGASFETAYYNAAPTVDRKILMINYGRECYAVSPDLVFACLNEAETHLNSDLFKKLKVSEDILFNRAGSTAYNLWFSPKLRADKKFVTLYGSWMTKYDKGTRLVAKMLLNRYRKERKGK